MNYGKYERLREHRNGFLFHYRKVHKRDIPFMYDILLLFNPIHTLNTWYLAKVLGFVSDNGQAIMAGSDGNDNAGMKHIFFIAETKGSMDSMQLKGIERAKKDLKNRLKKLDGTLGTGQRFTPKKRTVPF